MENDLAENKGCVANFGTFLMLFLGSCFVGFISFQIMFQILAEGSSSGYGDIVLALVALGITAFAFLVSSIFFVNLKNNSKYKSNWPLWIIGIMMLICFLIYIICLLLVTSDY